MTASLKEDNVSWTSPDSSNKTSLTKMPLICSSDFGSYSKHNEDEFYIHPITIDSKNPEYHGVVYWMLQATGFKLTSNKELPSPYQEFSQLIPPTTKSGSAGNYTVNAAADQKFPMFAIIDVGIDNYEYGIELIRINNILVGGGFKQTSYGTSAPVFEYCYGKHKDKDDLRYKGWISETDKNFGTSRHYIITI